MSQNKKKIVVKFRRDWNGTIPVTRKIESKKLYCRKRDKRNDYE